MSSKGRGCIKKKFERAFVLFLYAACFVVFNSLLSLGMVHGGFQPDTEEYPTLASVLCNVPQEDNNPLET